MDILPCKNAHHLQPNLPIFAHPEIDPKWFAVYTMPQTERSVIRHLDARQIESFLPTYETMSLWKNRQRVKIIRPLFPSYVFVRICAQDRGSVLGSPGALRIVGNCQGPLPVPETEIEFLRSDFCRSHVEPFYDLVIGKKVRIKAGPMQGVQGTLIQKKSGLRFVLTIALINQNAALEVRADDLEPVIN
ncbi:UpxY family transcription antiterminator [Telmatobacter sp. DSM 110680]|uniref:UpxY family transcription antiterminator n=1 Tax=Telmatobacter sp. DSM 110680 TaxID=3036704 RepID=A0AAU7DIL1_9BACT